MAAAISTRFLQLLQEGYQMVGRLEVLNPAGQVILDSATAGSTLIVVGGSISVDGSASFRRSITNLTLVDPTGTLVPTSVTAALSPAANNELRISVGAMVDGTPEYIPQGIFHHEASRVEDTGDGLTITLTAYDRARKYSRARRVVKKVFDASASTYIRDAILSLLQDAYPTTTLSHDSPAALTPSQVLDIGGDPWAFSRELADSMGYELYFDRFGNCILSRVVDPNSSGIPVTWTYREGSGGLLGAVRDQSNENVFNGVAVTGENPSNGSPVRVIVWDDNPASPTYYLGPYGKVPDFVQSDKVRTVDQATDMATGRLSRNKGLTEQVEFTIVPNPAIEPGDGVHLVRARAGLPDTGPGSEAVIVDRYSLELSATGGAMTISCRQRRVSV